MCQIVKGHNIIVPSKKWRGSEALFTNFKKWEGVCSLASPVCSSGTPNFVYELTTNNKEGSSRCPDICKGQTHQLLDFGIEIDRF